MIFLISWLKNNDCTFLGHNSIMLEHSSWEFNHFFGKLIEYLQQWRHNKIGSFNLKKYSQMQTYFDEWPK